MFNEYIWDTYLKSGGKNVAKMFEDNLTNEYTANYAEEVLALHRAYCPSKTIHNLFHTQLADLYEDLNSDKIGPLLEDGEYSIETAMDELYKGFKNDENASPQMIFSWFSDSIEYFTTCLMIEIPELFVPYYFRFNYNVLKMIAEEFGIDFPPIPVKKNYEERFFYYGKICAALYDFRQEHHITPYELCAFLYDFAPKYIGGIDSYIIKNLPEPKSAFFIGGSKNDMFLEDNTEVVSCWQCNPDTRAGDMIVMYLKSPISAVDSVWRSVSIGFNDPFFYYYRCTYISNPVRIKRISQKQLQQDKIFKDLPIVHKNMQGINGVELRPSEYNHLMGIATADNVPKLEFIVCNGNQELTNEKDVENKLIKPLIAKLGYLEDEYMQQLYIEIGNHNHMLIPDFVILPNKVKGQQSAFAILEAKFDIPNLLAFKEVKIQARSYARQLVTKYSIIASKEKIWISMRDDDYTKDIFVSTWDELNDADMFSKLYKMIGKNKKL